MSLIWMSRTMMLEHFLTTFLLFISDTTFNTSEIVINLYAVNTYMPDFFSGAMYSLVKNNAQRRPGHEGDIEGRRCVYCRVNMEIRVVTET